jgi:GNAT superfamily N-acetyltransferase
MTLTIRSVDTRRDLKRFVTFPWRVYRDDHNWVPPLIASQMDKLTPGCNPFWEHAERALWLAQDDGRSVGTIAAIIDHAGNRALDQTVGGFGFFECVNGPAAARLLLDTAGEWLAARGMTTMCGPYNPGANDDPGLLVEGYDTRPALMEGHTPPYYIELVEAAGFHKLWDTVAWLSVFPPEARRVEDITPPKLLRTAQWAASRSQARLRPVDLSRWEAEIAVACQIYNAASAHLPNFVPFPEAEFQQMAASFKPLVDPALAFFAEVNGEPVAFALTLPDLNEALQHVNGRLGPIGVLRLWWHSRHLRRATFKILMIRPEFRGRGLESLLTTETARVIFDRGYREVDMSLTGEDNENMQRMMAGLGMQVYRRYRVYERELGA